MSGISNNDDPVGAGDGARLGRQRDGPHQPITYSGRLALFETADENLHVLGSLFAEGTQLVVDFVGNGVGLAEGTLRSPERVRLAVRPRRPVVHPLVGDLRGVSPREGLTEEGLVSGVDAVDVGVVPVGVGCFVNLWVKLERDSGLVLPAARVGDDRQDLGLASGVQLGADWRDE